VIVCDTGPLVAAAIKNDAHIVSAWTCSPRCTSQAAGFSCRAPSSPRLAIFSRATAGSLVEAQFVTSLADGTLWPVELTREDYRRAGELMRTYQSLPLGTTDATVIAACERLGLSEVATLDRRHFGVVRPRHVDTLTLFPE
jgi:predicted nucleic acid-binding protein